LAVVQRAVQVHGGLILTDSTPGQGATFTIFFPSQLAVAEAS